MTDLNLKQTLKFTENLCVKVGQFIIKNRNKFQVTVHKTDLLDITTNIDLEAEKIVINHLSNKFPNFNICSEEKGVIDKKSSYTWVIDPLDGTKEFVRSIPSYSVNISLEIDKELLLGVTYNPNTQYLYSVAKNYGAFLNHRKINVSQTVSLSQSMIYTHLPDYRHKKNFSKIWSVLGKIAIKSYRLRGLGEDINSLCLVALGAIEGMILINSSEGLPKWWDVAAGMLMVKEAGGIVTNTFGKPIINRDLSKGIIAANAKIHAQLLNIMKKEVR